MSVPRRKRRIAFLVNDLSGTYQVRFLGSVEKAAARHGVSLLVLCGRELAHQNPNERTQNVIYSEWLGADAVDGVIVLAAAMANYAGTQGLIDLCARLRPVPVCSIGLVVPGVPSIVIDNRAAMRVGIEHLIHRHGRTRIGYIGGPADNEEAAARLLGYQDALRDAGLPFDPDLVAYGYFTAPTGRDAMREILARAPSIDALAAANDDMAMGACDVLREGKLSVSEDVLVVGFDDSAIARYASRSLTSVAQPMDHMADAAVSELLSLMSGEPAFDVRHLDVHLVLRESCGCGYIVRSETTSPPLVADGASVVEYLRENEQALIRELLPGGGTSRELWAGWSILLVRALHAELVGKGGTFLRVVEEVADDAARNGVSIDEVSRAVSQLRLRLQPGGADAGLHVEQLWMKALTILSAATTRVEGRAALEVQVRANELRHTSQRLSIALGPDAVATALEESLPALDVHTALLAVQPSDEPGRLTPLLAVRRGRRLHTPRVTYAASALFPPEFDDAAGEDRSSLVLTALTFENEVLGLLAFDGGADAFVCEALRSQVSAALKLGALHRRVLEETTLRERLAHQQLLGEMAIAKRLQTALTPKDHSVPGLEIAAALLPADEVGGDYYDVLPNADGAWIGIGDVTGHGLLAGLVMLMIQSIVSTLCGTRPGARPSELVRDLNRVLVPNIRERLEQDEHVTLVLLRYFEDGRVVFAGAHEDVLVWRKRTRAVEIVPTEGVWLGIQRDIADATRDASFTLDPGDLMVLYTDGVVEARDARGEAFGIERLVKLVEASADLPVAVIQAEIVDAVRAWFPVQQDDVTCLVARRTPAPELSRS